MIVKKCNWNQKPNNDKCRWKCKNPKENCVCEKNYIWNLATRGFNESIIDDSVVMCDEIIEEIKAIPTKSASTKAVLTKCTWTNFYILLGFLLIAIGL